MNYLLNKITKNCFLSCYINARIEIRRVEMIKVGSLYLLDLLFIYISIIVYLRPISALPGDKKSKILK